MDMRDFLLGDAEKSGRDTILCFQGNRLQAVKWRQWKITCSSRTTSSTWTPYNMPHLHNLEWDPREEHEVDFPHAWVAHPMAAAAGAFMKTLAIEPRSSPGHRTRTNRRSPANASPGAPPARTDHAVRHHAALPEREAARRGGPPARPRDRVTTHGA